MMWIETAFILNTPGVIRTLKKLMIYTLHLFSYTCAVNTIRNSLLLTMLAIIVATAAGWKWGAGITPDSCGYLSAARSLAAEGNLVQYNGTMLTNWPLLYPVLLGAAAMAGIDPLKGALLLNTAAIMLCALFLYRRYSNQSPFLYLLYAFLLSYPLLRFQLYLLTECLFISLLIPCFVHIRDFYANQRMRHLLIAALLASLMCLLRYAGIYLCLVTGAAILFGPGRARHAILFLCVSLLPVTLNIMLNMQYDQAYATMERSGSLKRAGFLLTNLRDFFSGSPLPAVLLLLVPSIGLLILFLRTRSRYDRLVVALCASYILACLSSDYLGFDEYLRYALIMVPLLLLSDAVSNLAPKIRTLAPLLFIVQLLAMPVLLYTVHHNGTGGYNKKERINEALREELGQIKRPLLGNAPDYCYFLNETRSDYLSTDQETFARQLRSPAVIIWVSGIRESYLGKLKPELEKWRPNKKEGQGYTLYLPD